MADILLIVALVLCICLGFPVMKRLDRYLDECVKPECERRENKKSRTGK